MHFLKAEYHDRKKSNELDWTKNETVQLLINEWVLARAMFGGQLIKEAH